MTQYLSKRKFQKTKTNITSKKNKGKVRLYSQNTTPCFQVFASTVFLQLLRQEESGGCDGSIRELRLRENFEKILSRIKKRNE